VESKVEGVGIEDLAARIDEAIYKARGDRALLCQIMVTLSGYRTLAWIMLSERRKSGRPPREPEHALTVTEASKRLHVHDDTMRALCRARKIRCCEIKPGHFRIPESAVEELLAGHGPGTHS